MECKDPEGSAAAAASTDTAAASASSSLAAASSAAAAASSTPAPAPAAAAAAPSSGSVVSLSEVALLVDHYLVTHYPKVVPLFRLEAKGALGTVKAAANPRSLQLILNEYVQLKSKADRERALTRALCNQADPSGAAAAAAPESCVLTRTMATLTSLLSAYSTHKHHKAGLPSKKRALSSVQTAQEPSKSIAMQDVAVAPVESKDPTGISPAAAATAAAAATPASVEPTPSKRRRKARPTRSILPTPVSADEPTTANPAFALVPMLPTLSDLSAAAAPAAAAAAASSDSGPLSPLFLRPQSPFQLPDHLPVQKLGSDGFVTMSVDREAYESLWDHHQPQGAFVDTIAALINERQGTVNQPNQHQEAAASPRPFLSPSAVDAIAEQLLTHPPSMVAMDSSFYVEVVPASTTPIKQPSGSSVRSASQSRSLAASGSPIPRATRSDSAARSPSRPKPTGVAAPLPSATPPPLSGAAAASSSAASAAAAPPSSASLLSLLHAHPVDTIMATRRATSNGKRS